MRSVLKPFVTVSLMLAPVMLACESVAVDGLSRDVLGIAAEELPGRVVLGEPLTLQSPPMEAALLPGVRVTASGGGTFFAAPVSSIGRIAMFTSAGEYLGLTASPASIGVSPIRRITAMTTTGDGRLYVADDLTRRVPRSPWSGSTPRPDSRRSRGPRPS